MLRVSPDRQAVLLQDDRDQDLIGPGARHRSLAHHLRKDRRPLADGLTARIRDEGFRRSVKGCFPTSMMYLAVFMKR